MTCPLGDSAANRGVFEPSPAAIDPVRILVVEDEVLVALCLSDMLEELRYDVCGVAASGAQALDIAERERPTLALVDIGLNGALDGIQTACCLRERYAIPSLFMSGASDAETLERAMAAEPHGFLAKPYSAADLKEALDGIFCAA